MSVIELPGSSSRELERTPPQDINAEQAVLGAMLLSPGRNRRGCRDLEDGEGLLAARDTPWSSTRFCGLYGAGQPADAVTVAAAGCRARTRPASPERRLVPAHAG